MNFHAYNESHNEQYTGVLFNRYVLPVDLPLNLILGPYNKLQTQLGVYSLSRKKHPGGLALGTLTIWAN